jgi:NAD(P)H-dependent flavin oxidoreductase YrpB (nitropropane dioxygenase family)
MSKDLVGSKEELIAKEEARSLDELMKEMMHYAGALEGDMDDSGILVGQSGGVINSIESIDDIVSSIMSDAERLIKNAYNSIK